MGCYTDLAGMDPQRYSGNSGDVMETFEGAEKDLWLYPEFSWFGADEPQAW